jgi:hypothetical protein
MFQIFTGCIRIPDAWIPNKHEFTVLPLYFENSTTFYNDMGRNLQLNKQKFKIKE